MHNNTTLFGRKSNAFLYAHKSRRGVITEQTWYNLRVEYIDELTYQFGLRDKLKTINEGTMLHESVQSLIDKSCERCRNYDFIIQENANKIIKAS